MKLLAIMFVLALAMALAAISATDAEALTDKQCDTYICVGMHDSITNRIQVESVDGQYIRVLAITAYRDTTSEWLSWFPECSEQFCRYERQKSRRMSKHLNYRCRSGEEEVGVYVVYDTGRIKALPSSGGYTSYSAWSNSIKLPVSC